MHEKICPQGKVEVFVTKGMPRLVYGERLKNGAFSSCEIDFADTELVEKWECFNIVVDQGKDKLISAVVNGAADRVGRMAIGDRGTIPSDSTVPKVPTTTMTALYNEIYRADINATVLDVGTPGVHSAKFITTFSAVDIPISSFSNQAQPVINEVGLITYDENSGSLPRAPVAAPNAHSSDEKLFSIRTFKSVPFEAANEIAVTIRYIVFIE